jgi:ubiquinone/menaquinone biosynthesis C-methylase UbiE
MGGTRGESRDRAFEMTRPGPPATSVNATRLAAFYESISPSLERIRSALSATGVDLDAVQASDLYLRDLDCHNLGMHGMLEVLAGVAQEYGAPSRDDVVLDLGCGMGGPGRFLVDRFGCSVVGVDLLAGRIELARGLTEMTGMTDRISYRVGSATDLAFGEGAFSQVWMLDVGIHIRDKRALFEEIARVLAPGGLLVMHDQTSPIPKAMLPVTRQVRYVATSLPQLLRYVEGASMRLLSWRDTSEQVLAFFLRARSMVPDGAAPGAGEPTDQGRSGRAVIDGYIETLASLGGRTGIVVAKRPVRKDRSERE